MNAAAARVLSDATGQLTGAAWLTLGVVTLLIFTAAVVYLRAVASKSKATDD